jgi:ribosomal protein S18 acetylase RimI-like enzyme
MEEYRIYEYIPEVNKDEASRLAHAYLEIWNDPENLRFLSLSGKPFQETQLQGWFSNHVSKGIRYFVACKNNDQEIKGIIIVRGIPTQGMRLGSIGIRPTYKGLGIGKRLVEECVDLTKSDRYRCISTEVFANNFRMIRLLTRYEFTVVKIDYHSGSDGTDFLYFKKYI